MKCTEEECLADFVIRKKTRLQYPGACSLEFQSVMQILTKCLLKWDIKKRKSTGQGILGTILAFFGADEEQGRKTLHRHWQIWTKEMNQTLRNSLFDNDLNKRKEARITFTKLVDSFISVGYGSQFTVTHKCMNDNNQETTIVDTPENIFKENEPGCFRDARHKESCNDVNGNVMFCQSCNKNISTTYIINQSLQRWKDICLPGIRAQDNRPDTIIPISRERLDMAAYLHSYHMNEGCARELDPYWGKKEIRDILLKYRFEEHSANHAGSCFKKGCECRFLYPFMSSSHTYIHEDRGDNNNNNTLRYSLDGSTNTVCPFMVILKRPMGCQFINSHNTAISEVLNCNTNLQIGDASQVFYSTLYTSKSTQDEDGEKQLRIGRAVIKRIKRLIEETPIINEPNGITYEPSFGEGLSRVLSGLNASTSRAKISSTMAHLISCNNGSRFVYSHEFSNLLVTQMEATLEEQETFVRIRTSKVPGSEIQYWTDSLAHDYLHRPIQPEFERICFYQMTSEYKKEYKKYKATKFDKYEFSENHPGHEFSRLSKLKYPTIPKISLPPYKLCSLEELDLHHEKSTEKSYDKRETYAKMALIMFYPYRTLNDLKIDGSFWKQFNKQRRRYINGKKTKFWPKGFDILQNIEDILLQQKHVKRARDPISIATINKKPLDIDKTHNDRKNIDRVADILDMGTQSRLVLKDFTSNTKEFIH